MKKLIGLVICFAFISGCATAPKYIPSIPQAVRSPKPTEQVALFYAEKDVAFPYVEIGRIFLRVRPHLLRHPADQIETIREEAAARGADAVILISSNASTSFGDVTANHYGVQGDSYGIGGVMYSGIVIIKK